MSSKVLTMSLSALSEFPDFSKGNPGLFGQCGQAQCGLNRSVWYFDAILWEKPIQAFNFKITKIMVKKKLNFLTWDSETVSFKANFIKDLC